MQENIYKYRKMFGGFQLRSLTYEVKVMKCFLSSVGHEYEFHLRRELDRLNIGYYSEDELRSRGYDKTPDIKLHVPIGWWQTL